ncbi:MAG TPA: hypothetical protein VFN72_00110, partial [Solirubrobacterales bacterium]|nr:hypothetical protein [Solirubrobacterales bacterium]
ALVTVSKGQATGRDAGHAVAAKKCKKKKKKHSASSAKKKHKCKKVHHVVLPAPAPLVRATLAWTANNEVDLHAFDPSGNHAGWDFGVNGLVNNIPNARHGGDSGGLTGGTETFTDDIYVVGGPSNREFAYVACLYSFTGTDDYTATFSGVTRSGTTTTLTLEGTPGGGTVNDDDIYKITAPGGPTLTDDQAFNTCEG